MFRLLNMLDPFVLSHCQTLSTWFSLAYHNVPKARSRITGRKVIVLCCMEKIVFADSVDGYGPVGVAWIADTLS